MRFVDSHAHLDFPQYNADRAEIIASLKYQEIDVINISTSLESVGDVVRLASEHDHIWGLVGLHPTEITQENLLQLPELINDWDKLIRTNSKIVGVGEIGLDYYHNKTSAAAAVQKTALRQFLSWAKEKDYPVSFHCRDAYGDLLTILADYPGLRGVVHCFSGSNTQAEGFLNLGLHISFTAIITYPGNEELRQVVKQVPLEKILIETDAPFLPVNEKRGQRNDPGAVIAVASKIAELKDISPKDVAEATNLAADTLFGLRSG